MDSSIVCSLFGLSLDDSRKLRKKSESLHVQVFYRMVCDNIYHVNCERKVSLLPLIAFTEQHVTTQSKSKMSLESDGEKGSNGRAHFPLKPCSVVRPHPFDCVGQTPTITPCGLPPLSTSFHENNAVLWTERRIACTWHLFDFLIWTAKGIGNIIKNSTYLLKGM